MNKGNGIREGFSLRVDLHTNKNVEKGIHVGPLALYFPFKWHSLFYKNLHSINSRRVNTNPSLTLASIPHIRRQQFYTLHQRIYQKYHSHWLEKDPQCHWFFATA